MLKILLLIGSGSFIGGILRYLISRHIQFGVFSTFPWGTFAVNMIGCLFVGLFYGISSRDGMMSNEWKMFLTVGFCGGFTTFSTFSVENIALIRDGNFLLFATYASLSLFIGIMATYSGNLITKIL
jgi:fluoride exporter